MEKQISNFYPRPPRGGRPEIVAPAADGTQFLSTPSARRATKLLTGGVDVQEFLSTPSARRATEIGPGTPLDILISIHALREEGDAHCQKGGCLPCNFYPRPPRGGRQASNQVGAGASLFLSTPSARRATETVDLTITWCFISIHALREEGDFRASLGWAHLADFYPRPPRGGRRVEHIWPESKPKFLSTPSARRATQRSPHTVSFYVISIHALREEGDGRSGTSNQ